MEKHSKNSYSKKIICPKKVADGFVENLANDAHEKIKIEKDRKFLELQRQKGRPGSMAGIDISLYEREKRAHDRREREKAHMKKHQEELSQHNGELIH